jgi:hypothetical protein
MNMIAQADHTQIDIGAASIIDIGDIDVEAYWCNEYLAEVNMGLREREEEDNVEEPGGDTAIWDSIALAQDQRQDYANQYPNARLRIICILD